jgi:hypothetical protein
MNVESDMGVKYVPIKIKPDCKARGWKPVAGWYIWDAHNLVVDWYQTAQIRGGFDKPFLTKRGCQRACDKLMGENKS